MYVSHKGSSGLVKHVARARYGVMLLDQVAVIAHSTTASAIISMGSVRKGKCSALWGSCSF